MTIEFKDTIARNLLIDCGSFFDLMMAIEKINLKISITGWKYQFQFIFDDESTIYIDKFGMAKAKWVYTALTPAPEEEIRINFKGSL